MIGLVTFFLERYATPLLFRYRCPIRLSNENGLCKTKRIIWKIFISCHLLLSSYADAGQNLRQLFSREKAANTFFEANKRSICFTFKVIGRSNVTQTIS